MTDAVKSIGRLHVITDEVLQTRFSHVELAEASALGGADVVQYREKRDVSTRELIETTRSMREVCEAHGVTLLVDDRVDVAAAAGALAVHLGRDDLPAEVARRLLGAEALIGGTANSIEEAVEVAKSPVDYLGVGPVFGTTSKG